ncbi:putative RING-H2 finger protein ATL72 [Cocos nucifera]|uniref:Putative RING-H2 finger protein ATL72 n=1 Tax=Cocos nucifera TaxID=13894 RepID=A0A8K0N4C4_COCNU|nr:putative RING-H2 finger protein ATL72 [Cocos nucifera]
MNVSNTPSTIIFFPLAMRVMPFPSFENPTFLSYIPSDTHEKKKKKAIMPFHRYHRLLLDPAAVDQPNNLEATLTVSVAAVFAASAMYLVLGTILQCIRLLFQRQPDLDAAHAPNATVLAIPPAQLEAIAVIVYGDLPASLPSFSAASPEAESCPVCLAEYVAGEEVRVLPRCGHMFHKGCIDRWLLTSSSLCPICRDRVIEREVQPATIDCGVGSRSGGQDGGLQVQMEIHVLPRESSSSL